MAWAEKMSSGRWRGRYRDQAGNVQTVIDGDVGFTLKSEAKEAAEDAASQGRRRAAVDAGRQSARIPWGQLQQLFAEKRRKGDTETANTERYIIDQYVYPRWGDVPLNEISRRRIQAWVTNDIKPGKKPSYVHRIYQVFAAPIGWAVEEEILELSPCTRIDLPPIPDDEQKPYFDDEYLALLTPHLNEKLLRAVQFQYETALRPGELGGLHIHRIDRRVRLLYVADVYVSRLKLIRPTTKNGKIESIPLTTRALEILDEVLDGRDARRGCGLPHSDGARCKSDVVFRTVRDVPLNPRNYYMLLTTAAENAGVDLRSPYAGRRGTSTRLAEAGVSSFDIAAMMRHHHSQTPRYVQKGQGFGDRIRAGLGDGPQLTVIEGGGARGAARGADPEKQASSAKHPADDESVG